MAVNKILVKHDNLELKHIFLLLGIVALATLVRIVSFESVSSVEPDRIVAPDTPRYEKPAKALIATGSMRDRLPLAETQDLHVGPAYPLFIAALYYFSDENRKAVVYAQIAVGALSIILVFLVGREVYGRLSGLAAAGVFALDPLQTLHAQILLGETLFVFFVTMSAWAAVRVLKYYHVSGGLKRCLFLGISLGLATLVKPAAYYIVFFLLVGIFVYHLLERRRFIEYIPFALTLIVSFAAIVAPWHIRNEKITGAFVFTDNPAEILLYWRAGGMIAHRDGRAPEDVRRELVEQVEGRYATLIEKMTLENNLGKEIILSDIPAFLVFYVDGVKKIIVGPGLRKFSGFYGGEQGGRSARNNSLFIWYVLLIAYSLSFLLILYSLIIVMLLKPTNGKSPGVAVVLLLCLAAYFVLAAAGHSSSDSRMRVPAMPMMAVLAGYGLIQLRQFLGRF